VTPTLNGTGTVRDSSRGLRNAGVQAALLSALLFGASAPLAKLLLGAVSPMMVEHPRGQVSMAIPVTGALSRFSVTRPRAGV